jgi:predicted O-methyltransferase YrrM
VDIARTRAPHGATVTKSRGASVQSLARMVADGQAEFDLVYVDGSHLAQDVLTDAVLSFRLLKRGGLAIFDDYLWLQDSESISQLDRPKVALDAFVNVFCRSLRILPGLPLNQLYVEKS